MIADLQPGDVVIAKKIDRISRLPLPEAEKLIASIRRKDAKLAIPGIVDLSELAAESDGVSRIVLESVQELLLKLALQTARDDYELRRSRQRQGVQLAKAAGKYCGRKADLTTHERIITLRQSGLTIERTATLAASIDEKQMLCLLELLSVPAGSRYSLLEQLRTGPTKVNAASLLKAISRLHTIRSLSITLPTITPVSDTRIAALARYAATAKTSALERLPEKRKLATLVAFACSMEATAQDDTIELLEALLRDLFNGTAKADKKNRQRTIKDLDRAAEILAKACKMLLDDVGLRY